MTSRPHDALFKAAFETPEHASGLFRVLLPQAVCAAIDWSSAALRSGSFIDPDLADGHSDLLFSVELAGAPALLYLLLEHRSSGMRTMPLRMAHYVVRIWKRYVKDHDLPLPVILPALVTHAVEGWTGPRALHELIEPAPASVPGLAPLVLDYSMLVLDLTALDDAKLRSWAFGAFPTLALVFLRDARDKQRLRQNFERWRDVFLEVLRAPNGADAVQQVLRYIALVTGDLHFGGFRATILSQLPEAEEIVMTVAQELRQEGLQEGLEKGLEKGRREERAEILVKLLTLEFGSLSPVFLARIEAATYEQLGVYLEAVSTAESLESLFSD